MMQQHPYQLVLHKYMSDLLEEKYQTHSNIVSRISHYLVTEQDLREFSSMLGDMYEKAYTKALKDYHVQLEAAGIKVAVSYANRSSK